MPTPPRPGLLILHGNRLEDLAQTVLAWLQRHPLGLLDEEHVLVQSNGMAEWLKMQIAGQLGVCAATRVELPARFVWRAYRAVLGADAVPPVSVLDKLPLAWRLMRLLPVLAPQPGFEPVAGFLRADEGSGFRVGAGAPVGAVADAGTRVERGLDPDPDPDPGPNAVPATRLLQLARRLADLFDQYQVYRSDWLQDWAQGADRLRLHAASPQGAQPLQPDQAWQALLWRAVLAELADDQRAATRAQLHPRFVAALQAGTPPPPGAPALPQRLVLFGTTHIPHQTLEAIAALAPRCQVLIAVPNPCRYHWADIIEGGEPLRHAARRHALRLGVDTSQLAPQDLHAHGHPLLAAWGRQGRDFVRQLDAFDDVQRARAQFDVPRIDLFDDAPGRTLLQQLQADIRDLEPLPPPLSSPLSPDAPPRPLPAGDRSIVFHVTHSALREVEVLHDQLLHRLAQPGTVDQPALSPRDIVVMVPDIDSFAPAIRSVFGQVPRGHARHIPWGLADQRDRGRHPLLLALDALLHAPTLRFAYSELQAWLDVPAVARRMGLRADDAPTLLHWLQGAGVRWGLHAAQRSALGLGACGDSNSWAFGLRRMLLGYATGALSEDAEDAEDAEGGAEGFAGIEPYAEVAGLDAHLAGCAAEWLHTLQGWWADAAQARTPAAWGERLRTLLAELFEPSDDTERAWLAALDQALGRWLQACDLAQFDSPVPLAVAREAWLDALDEPDAARRFKAGGVTFCTLLPLRAIPFGMVCLLGMNDSDYPRSSTRADFDLMALPGLARPGDRSRRHDDRQLMLDALLSARQVLYISWAGRSPRDNSEQPPSVLVGQLRDHLVAVWGSGVLAPRTTHHPLQPFSRRYFEVAAPPVPVRVPVAMVPVSPSVSATGETPIAVAAGAGLASTTAPASGGVLAAAAAVAAHAAATATGAAAAAGDGLFTYAAEWRSAHLAVALTSVQAAGPAPPEPAGPAAAADPTPLTLAALQRFLRNPVQDFFRHRLQVRFDDLPGSADDDEAFATTGLDRWQLLDEALRHLQAPLRAATDPGVLLAQVRARLAAQRRAGRLPLGGPGQQAEQALLATLQPMLEHAQRLYAQHPPPPLWAIDLVDPEDPTLRLLDRLADARADVVAHARMGARDDAVGEVGAHHAAHSAEAIAAVVLADDGLAQADLATPNPAAAPGAPLPLWVTLQASKICDDGRKHARADKLLAAWLGGLAAAAMGRPVAAAVIGANAVAWVRPADAATARQILLALMRACRQGLAGAEPWPVALRTALAALREGSPHSPKVREVYEGGDYNGTPGEGTEPCLARLFPDADSLVSAPGFEQACATLYGGLHLWLMQDVDLQALPGQQAGLDDEPGDDSGDGGDWGGAAGRTGAAPGADA